jgi:peptide/nickel transport system permease protein
MAWFLGKRALQAVPVLVAVVVLSFVVIRLVPGDPVKLMLGFRATPEQVALVERDLGLDRSLGDQLVTYFRDTLSGDFGNSIIKRAPVSEIVSPRILPSVYLMLYSTVLALLLAVPLGVLSALRRDRLADQVVRLLGMVAFAMPSFWLGLMLALAFALHLDLLPVSGYDDSPLGLARTLLLPSATLALYLAPMLIRTLRASLIEALGHESVEAARARGLPETVVVGKYALRTSLVPLVTVLSINVGFLISGTVIVENVFQIPGLGSLLVQSVLTRDFPVIQALVFVFGVMVIVTNLLADASYALADPRVRRGALA